MLSPSHFIALVDREVEVARQVASALLSVDENGQTSARIPRVAFSSPVVKLRQRSCSVLVELTRPLPWLSGRADDTFLSNPIRHSSREETMAKGSISPTSRMPSAGQVSLPPLQLMANATLEASFPAAYPLVPCVWSIANDVSLRGKGNGTDHHSDSGEAAVGSSRSTASWAVVSHPSRGPVGGDGYARYSSSASTSAGVPSRPRTPAAGRVVGKAMETVMVEEALKNRRARGDLATTPADTAATTVAPPDYVVHALVMPPVVHRLLTWVVEQRSRTQTVMAEEGEGNLGYDAANAQSPFLADIAVLLRDWAALELGVHTLVLPTRLVMAFSGSHSAVRVLGGTHLSGGSSSSAGGGSSGGGAAAGGGAGGVGGSRETAHLIPSMSQGGAMGSGSGGGSSAGASPASPYRHGSGAGSSVFVPAVGTAALSGGISTALLSQQALGAGSGATLPIDTGAVIASPSTATTLGSAATVVGGTTLMAPHNQKTHHQGQFVAIFLPQGSIAVWGTPRFQRTDLDDDGAVAGGVPTWESQHLSLSLQWLSRPAPPAKANRPSFALTPPRPINGPCLSLMTVFAAGQPLPSLVMPSHVLHSLYRCDWSAVHLYTGTNAGAALQANAKLAKALRLPHISDVLNSLRRLSWNSGEATTTGNLYFQEMVWPALVTVVQLLRRQGEAFWAGVAVCSLLCPSVLQDRGGWILSAEAVHTETAAPNLLDAFLFDKAKIAAEVHWLRQIADLIDAVRYVEEVLFLAGEYTQMTEARLVRRALERCSSAVHCAPPNEEGIARTKEIDTGVQRNIPEDSFRRYHAPISICAVCGLALMKNVKVQLPRAAVAADVTISGYTAGSAAAAVVHSVECRQREGCLVVQCARCGHGGHVQHIISWWTDPMVQGCPKGCACNCMY